MPFVRLTMASPRAGRRAEVRKHYEDLIIYLSKLPGFIDGWVMTASDDSGEVGRMTMWESEEAANHAANDPHTMAVHAELHFDVTGNLWDRSLNAERPAGLGR